MSNKTIEELEARIARLEAIQRGDYESVQLYAREMAHWKKLAEANASDAARWRALLSSGRLRALGCAGFNNNTIGHAHLGLELWTTYPEPHPSLAESNARCVAWLTTYTDIMLKASVPASTASSPGRSSGVSS
jgi:hypothetical protein